jgi:outer membrane protein insertion porin family
MCDKIISTRWIKYFGIIILTAFLVLFARLEPAKAAGVKVMVFPFDVLAQQDLDYLRNQIATVLAGHLQVDGATIIELSESDRQDILQNPQDSDRLRNIGRRYGADRIIWGSFTQIGNEFSLDARLDQVEGKGPPAAFDSQGRDLETLVTVLKSLSGKLGRQIFQRKLVEKIEIKGNRRIEADAILRVIESKPGNVYLDATVSEDIRAIFEMGYFDDVRVESEPLSGGKHLIFSVKEKPTIRYIDLKGNYLFDDEEVEESLTISTGSILNIFKIRSNIDQIESMYREKNYHNVKVGYEIEPLENNQADLKFIIDEGDKLYVTSITFVGNKTFDEDDLEDAIETSEKGFFFWLTSSGDYDPSMADQDTNRLSTFYLNQGYVNARVSEPSVDFTDEGIQIVFKIEEGQRYKVGSVDLQGDLIGEKDLILEKLNIGKETYYNREMVRQDVILLGDLYGEKGYAYADIRPTTRQDDEKLVVDIKYTIDQQQQVYFENIMISGNTRTRDKVIRRELKVHEQDLYNGKALKRSVRNLYRLDYFEDIKINTLKGSADDKMVLKIDVTEKPTSMFQFGAGYSSEENLFLTASINQRNFLGRSQRLKLQGQIGGSTTQYTLSFTEPWLMDIPLSTTVSLYDRDKEYSGYDSHTVGGGVGLSYPIFDYTRIYWNYAYGVDDIVIVDEDEAPDSAIELSGRNITSSVGIALGWDSRDRAFNTSEGSKHKISFEYAGLGGNIGFNKIIADTGWYIPLFWELVGFVHGRAGYVYQNDDEKALPDYERFYLGGINSLRGFKYRDIHIKETKTESFGPDWAPDASTREVEKKRGGERMVQFNIELIFPIAKEVGLMGVVFYDTGNVYDDGIELDEMRSTYGGGFRWFSFVPIRLEYGRIIDPREGEDTNGRWEFTLGGTF